MSRYIVILGEISSVDFERVFQLTAIHSIEVQHFDSIPPEGFFSEKSIPLAFMSCFLADKSTMLQLFGSLPIGTGEQIPLFQLVTAGTIDPFLIQLPIQGFFEFPITYASVCTIIQSILRNEILITQAKKLKNEIVRFRNQKHKLAVIGTALTKESDLENLLKIILTVCREMVNADAGSIYVRERVTPGGAYAPYITFKVTQNDSIDVGAFNEFHLPIDENSIAGYVAKTARSLNISDVDNMPKSIPCHFDRNWEQKIGYRTNSMLTLPLRNIEGEVVGVLQLLNKKYDSTIQSVEDNIPEEACAFTLSDEEYVQSIASQAAVSIERAHYHDCIKALFEGFLGSSIAAIDERDKVTSGHSRRVMEYATAFAEAARHDPGGRFFQIVSSQDRIRQFQYAALLHDIGKIGVPESLLTKETRLDLAAWSNLQMRFQFIKLQLKFDPQNVDWDSEEQIDSDLEFLDKVNKTGFCDDVMLARLTAISKKEWSYGECSRHLLLSESEFQKLSIRKGNLTEKERGSINSHAVSTHRILSKIPWTKNLELVPFIAAQHHEKLNGTGYPDGLRDSEILIESKILAVIDIFEALVAQDRPYKPKIPVEKALAILREDAKNGLLDSDVIEFFIEKKIYETHST